MSYIVITTVKNEEKYFHFIARSMLSQTLRPSKWIIVDDGSTDNSAEVIRNQTKQHDWIDYIKFDDKGEKRSYGAKVIRAFNFGLRSISDNNYDFITKLDADLTLPDHYFYDIDLAFANDVKLGIAGGVIVDKDSDFEAKLQKDPVVEGAVKSIRKKCFDDIGGFWEINGWDGIDQHLARFKGWEVKNLSIPVLHHRPEAKEYLSLNFYFQNGRTSYILGNNFFLTIIRFIVRIKEKPFVLGAFCFLFGFIYAVFTEKRLVSKEFSKFIRKYNYSRILKGF